MCSDLSLTFLSSFSNQTNARRRAGIAYALIVADTLCDTSAIFSGWDIGVTGMCLGEKRKLKIPSDLGYGDTGSPPKIPGKSFFTHEIVSECYSHINNIL